MKNQNLKKIKVDFYLDENTDKISGWRRVFNEIYRLIEDKLDSRILTFNSRTKWIPYSRYYSYLFHYANKIKKYKRDDAVAFFPHQELGYLYNFFKFEKSIIICHDIIPFLYPNSLINKKFLEYALAGMKQASSIITDSESSKKDLIKYFNFNDEKIITIYPAVNTQFKKLNHVNKVELLDRYQIPLNKLYILYVGSEAIQKNIPRLLKAFKIISGKIPKIHLIKIGSPGSGADRSKTLKMINDLRMLNITIINNITEDDLIAFYNISNLLVYPSMYEGFGLPPLEAMACGCPVITSNISSLPEVVGKGAILVNPTDINSLSLAIYEVLTNSKLSKKLSLQGQLQSRKFKWEESASNFLNTIKRVNNK